MIEYLCLYLIILMVCSFVLRWVARPRAGGAPVERARSRVVPPREAKGHLVKNGAGVKELMRRIKVLEDKEDVEL